MDIKAGHTSHNRTVYAWQLLTQQSESLRRLGLHSARSVAALLPRLIAAHAVPRRGTDAGPGLCCAKPLFGPAKPLNAAQAVSKRPERYVQYTPKTFEKYWTCSGTRLVPSQSLQFLALWAAKHVFFSGSCLETEVSKQLY